MQDDDPTPQLGRARDQLAELEEVAGGPVARAPDEDTKPVHFLSASESELWDRLTRVKRELRRTRKESSDQLLEAMGDRPPAERLAALETRMRILYAILAAIATIALGSLVATARILYARGEAAGEQEARLHNVEQAADKNATRIDQIDRELIDRRRASEQDRAASTPTRTP